MHETELGPQIKKCNAYFIASCHMQSFKTLAHKLLVLGRTKIWPASHQLTLSGDLTWVQFHQIQVQGYDAKSCKIQPMECKIACTSHLIKHPIGRIFRMLHHIIKPEFGETRLWPGRKNLAGCANDTREFGENLVFYLCLTIVLVLCKKTWVGFFNHLPSPHTMGGATGGDAGDVSPRFKIPGRMPPVPRNHIF